LLRAVNAKTLMQALQALQDEGLAGELRPPVDMMLAMADHVGRWRELEEAAVEPLARGSKGALGPGHGGPVAGLTLLIPLVVSRKNERRRIGRGEAYRVIAQMKGSGAGERTLQENWKKYRGVAHIWAAAILRPDLMYDPRGLGEFVALAQQLRTEAGAYVPLREREPLLPLGASVNLDLLDLGGDIARPGGCPEWIDHIGFSPEMAKLLGLD
jgi:hypothetical protein